MNNYDPQQPQEEPSVEFGILTAPNGNTMTTIQIPLTEETSATIVLDLDAADRMADAWKACVAEARRRQEQNHAAIAAAEVDAQPKDVCHCGHYRFQHGKKHMTGCLVAYCACIRFHMEG